jgi:predicted O-methyltransferase YrrM
VFADASSALRTITSELTMLLADAITASLSSEALLSPGEQKLLYELARQVPRCGTIVELGSWMGGSTIMLAAGSVSGPQAKVYAVDAFAIVGQNALEYTDRVTGAGPDYLARFRSNIQRAGVESLVEPIQSLTLPAAAAWKGPAINLLFIDASHYYEDVARDFAAWAIHCARGASCVFHDYALTSAPGVKKFVDRAIARGLLEDVKFVDTIAHGKITTIDPRAIENSLKYGLSDLFRIEKNRKSWYIFSKNHGWMAWRTGDRRLALRYALDAIRWQPLQKEGWLLLACVVLNRKPDSSTKDQANQATTRPDNSTSA